MKCIASRLPTADCRLPTDPSFADYRDTDADGATEQCAQGSGDIRRVLAFEPLALHAVARPDNERAIGIDGKQRGWFHPDFEGHIVHSLTEPREDTGPDFAVRLLAARDGKSGYAR